MNKQARNIVFESGGGQPYPKIFKEPPPFSICKFKKNGCCEKGGVAPPPTTPTNVTCLSSHTSELVKQFLKSEKLPS